MGRFLPALLVLAAALVLWLLSDEEPAPLLEGGADVHIRVVAPIENPSALLAKLEETERDGERAALVAESANTASVEGATSPCRVFGSVVDARGAPLANVSVEFGEFVPQSFFDAASPTSTAHDVLTTTTDEHGRFLFEVERMPGATPHVAVLAGPYRSTAGKLLHSNGAVVERDGVREFDLGFFQLFDAGSIRGRVVDEGGAPIEGARIEVGESALMGIGNRATSAADGTYVLSGVPPGRYVVAAHRERRRSASVSDVQVEAGSETYGGQLVLPPAATIEGFVRDAAGAPIAGATVTSWPTDTPPKEASHELGGGALPLLPLFGDHPYAQVATREGQVNFGWTQCGSDGTFVLHVPEDVPHALVVQRMGFVDWDDRNTCSQIVRSGARDIVIVMEALPTAMIRVVDAASRAPIERFGVFVQRGYMESALRGSVDPIRSTASSAHPGGTASIQAAAGTHVVDVSAEGYVAGRFHVTIRDASDSVLDVALEPSARLVGRALRDGTPIANATVTLVGAQKENADEQRALHKEALRGDVTWYRPIGSSQRRARTDADGRFDVEIAHSGTALLVVDVGSGAVLEHLIERLDVTKPLDIGDVHAVAPGRIEGTVVTVPGVAPSGLVVALDAGRGGRMALVDESGRFVFEDVPPGGRHLQLVHRRAELGADEGRSVAVLPGTTTTVAVDSTELTVGRVELILDREAFGSDERTTIVLTEGRTSRSLGALDARGSVSFEARAGAAMHATVRTPLGAVVLRDQVFHAVPLVTTTVTLTASFGGVAVEWPANLALPQHAELELHLMPSSMSHVAQTVEVPLVHGLPEVDASADVRVADGRLEIDRILAGAWTVSATVRGQAEDGTATHLFSSTATLSIVAGERTVLVLQ